MFVTDNDEDAGFITGLNSPNLTRTVVWEFVYSFETLIQFMGRLARVQGQSGTCSFVTYPAAISSYIRNDSNSNEIAGALRSTSALDSIAFKAVHSDGAGIRTATEHQHELKDLKMAVAGTKWCQEIVRSGSGCIVCGTSAAHNTTSCPKLYGRCFQCGRHGHTRKACTESTDCFQVPEQFCNK